MKERRQPRCKAPVLVPFKRFLLFSTARTEIRESFLNGFIQKVQARMNWTQIQICHKQPCTLHPGGRTEGGEGLLGTGGLPPPSQPNDYGRCKGWGGGGWRGRLLAHRLLAARRKKQSSWRRLVQINLSFVFDHRAEATTRSVPGGQLLPRLIPARSAVCNAPASGPRRPLKSLSGSIHHVKASRPSNPFYTGT